MRGAPNKLFAEFSTLGIIPADAGSTLSCQRTKRNSQDHPRRCGEHLNAFASTLTIIGSSPQMRGALSWPQLAQLNGMDHPRRCGEHSAEERKSCTYSGSSPQMRGALGRSG